MTRFSLGGEDDGECSAAFPSKRKRVDDSEGDGSPEVEGEADALGVDEEEEEGGSGSNRLAVSSSKEEKGSLVVALTDPEALDCPICFEPLKAPVFQCENGHVACFTCSGKIKNICSFCSLPIGYIRCRVIERILQSTKLKCPNADQGCKRLFRYHEWHAHKRYCPFSPRSCPIHNCGFVAPSKQLSRHFSEMHSSNLILFAFGICQAMELPLRSQIYILQEQDRGVLFILRNEVHMLGNVMKIEFLAPPSERRYTYEIVAKANVGSLKLESNAADKNSMDNNFEIPFLVLPKHVNISGELTFCIRIPE
ncbi:hypothetical protein MLD38_022812 [Melastoma candidum]|uniref:Uncharacterized protein n=1 Tax=Melastoma candidum TaxID=119954 RepID=A0ACB9QTP1_9MYRT|nr:hypothetical protein MLD38_022812 [Melastoma candidum]